MSASNGTIEGVVEAVNDRGVRINGEWANVSKFRPVALPPVGARVHAELDAKGFLRELDVLDAAPTSTAACGISTVSRDRTITRLALVKAAATFAAARTDVKSADVLAIAKSWERWVLEQA